MKTLPILCLAALLTGYEDASAQIARHKFYYGPLPSVPYQPPTQEEITDSYLQSKKIYFVPRDPWREIGGQTTYAQGSNWVQFVGRVLQSTPDGIRVKGYYGTPMQLPDNLYEPFLVRSDDKTQLLVPDNEEFFIQGFPYQLADNDFISWPSRLVALNDGVYSYGTVGGSTRTLHKLTYGRVVQAPIAAELTPEEKAAQSKKLADEKAAAEKKALDWNQKQADAGDAYGQWRMGQRYLTGNGVDKNITKAREYFSKAADQGNPDAKKALESFSQDDLTASKK